MAFDTDARPRRDPRDRDQFYGESVLTAGPFFRGMLVAALALSVALLIAALSARQVSQRESALPILEASIEALTDPYRLAASQHETLRVLAEGDGDEPLVIPGYPLQIAFSEQEVTTLNDEQLGDLLVERSAAIVYRDGMSAFDQTGTQDDGLFSAQGVVRRTSDRLTEDSHSSATRAATVLLFLTAFLGVAVVLAYRQERRLRALGVGALIGALAGTVVTFVLRFAAQRVGSDDPFVRDVREIVTTVLEVPLRNFVIVALLGIALTALSLVLQLVRRRQEAAGDIPSGFEEI